MNLNNLRNTNVPTNGRGFNDSRSGIWYNGKFTPDIATPSSPGSGAAAGGAIALGAGEAGFGGAIATGGIVVGTALASVYVGGVFYEQAAVPNTWANNLASAIVDNPLAKGYMGLTEFAKGFVGLPGQPKGGKILQSAVYDFESDTGKVSGAWYSIRAKHQGWSGGEVYVSYYGNFPGPMSIIKLSQGNPATFELYIGPDREYRSFICPYVGTRLLSVFFIRADGTTPEQDAKQSNPNPTPVVPEIKIESGTNPVSPYGPVDSRTPPIPTDNPHSPQPQSPSNVDPVIQWPGLQPNPNPLATDSTWASVGKEVWEREGRATADRIRFDPNYRQTTKGGPPQLIPSDTTNTGAITKANAPATVVEPGNGQPAQLPTPNKSPQPGQTPTPNKSPGSGNASNPQPGQTPTPSGQTPTPSGNRQIIPTLTPSKSPNPAGTEPQQPTPDPVNQGRATRYNPVNRPTPDPFPEFDWKTGTYKIVTKDPTPTPTPTPTDNKFPKFDWVNGKFVDPITTPEPATKPSTPFIPGFPPVIPPAIVDEKKVSPIDPKTGKPPQPTPEPNKGTQTPPTTGGGSGGGTCMYPGYHGQVMSGHSATQTEVGAVNTLINTETNVAVRAVGDNVTAVKNAIGSPVMEGVSTVFEGVNKIQTFAENVAKSAHLDKVYNMLTLLVVLHNGAMLSRSFVDTVEQLFETGLEAVGIKDENNQPLQVTGVIGKTVSNFVKSIVGESIYNGVSLAWKKGSAIVTTAANVAEAITSPLAGLASGLTAVGNNTGKIGNALIKSGTVLENSYEKMSENVQVKTGRLAAMENYFTGVTNATELVESVTELTRVPIDTKASFDSVKDELKGLDDTMKLEIETKKTAEATAKTASQGAAISTTDLIKPE